MVNQKSRCSLLKRKLRHPVEGRAFLVYSKFKSKQLFKWNLLGLYRFQGGSRLRGNDGFGVGMAVLDGVHVLAACDLLGKLTLVARQKNQ
jgi:hypothetical protein